MKIEIFSSRSLLIGPLRHYFRIRAGNGQVLAHSEGYSRQIDALGTARLMKNGLHNAEIINV